MENGGKSIHIYNLDTLIEVFLLCQIKKSIYRDTHCFIACFRVILGLIIISTITPSVQNYESASSSRA